ncbi:uncharacterized protein N7503_007605 [Penicillium pulvis]|uniref:uncharacterized protein n=1 Tax=Penicillium pulvis TaxID=1562058 RepID=UPI0025476354|nr:uncharacterized protein N7503_007605 [Penicillium pulvis]KAJ5798309.1 hypothetical protein N7503_007605 [Penicillium pulvis]
MQESNEIQAELEALYAVFKATMTEHRGILESSGFFVTLKKCLPRLKNAVTLGSRFYATQFLLNIAKHTDFTCLGLRELKSQFKFKHFSNVSSEDAVYAL